MFIGHLDSSKIQEKERTLVFNVREPDVCVDTISLEPELTGAKRVLWGTVIATDAIVLLNPVASMATGCQAKEILVKRNCSLNATLTRS